MRERSAGAVGESDHGAAQIVIYSREGDDDIVGERH
jgi:hypothetical protein